MAAQRTRAEHVRLQRAVHSAVFDSIGSRIVAVGGRTVAVWPLGDNGAPWRHHLGWPVTQAVFSPDGSLVAVIGNNREARLYDASSGVLLRSFDQGDFVKAVAFSPKGEYLATGGRRTPAQSATSRAVRSRRRWRVRHRAWMRSRSTRTA